MEKDTIVINLIGGPCSGKSTLAAGIFYKLKCLNINCEMALEFAKDKVWEESNKTLDDQIYIFGKQYHKIWRLKDKVSVIITDSPLLMSVYYNKNQSDYFNAFILEQFNRFNNKNYFIERNDKTFAQEGRLQNLEQSKEIDKSLLDILNKYKIEYKSYPIENALDNIINDIFK